MHRLQPATPAAAMAVFAWLVTAAAVAATADAVWLLISVAILASDGP